MPRSTSAGNACERCPVCWGISFTGKSQDAPACGRGSSLLLSLAQFVAPCMLVVIPWFLLLRPGARACPRSTATLTFDLHHQNSWMLFIKTCLKCIVNSLFALI
jgi:hypothetical protein